MSFRGRKFAKTKKLVENLTILYYLLVLNQTKKRVLSRKDETWGCIRNALSELEGWVIHFFFKKKQNRG